jgi:DNA polymerase-1
MGKFSLGYEHYYPPVKLDLEFPLHYELKLLTSLDEMREIHEQFLNLDYSKVLAFDTETTGLDAEKLELVGFSFCFERRRAFYVPLRHAIGENADHCMFDAVTHMLLNADLVLMFNKKFDLRVIRKYGVPIDQLNVSDVQILSWLTDTNLPNPSLKESEKRFLGWEATTYEELVGKGSINMVDPVAVAKYAATDALGTYNLFEKLSFMYQECPNIIKIDNESCDVIMKIEDVPIRLDKPLLQEQYKWLEGEIRKIEQEVYAGVGEVFNIGSSQQLIRVLHKLGIRTPGLTKKGGMSTDEDNLLEIADKHPAIRRIIAYKKHVKMLGTYVKSLLNFYREDFGGCRFNYQTCRVPTGRLAGGSDKKNSYYAKVNIQAIPNSDPAMYVAIPKNYFDEEELDRGDLDCYINLLGWFFFPISDAQVKAKEFPEGAQYLVESRQIEGNVRCAFLPDPDSYFITIDYSGEEMRVAANLSGDPVMTEGFLSGEDFHKFVAIKMFGEENYNKERRKQAKFINFSVLFGGMEKIVSEQAEISVQEAKSYLDTWWRIHKGMDRWARGSVSKGRKTGTVTTAFGRPRRVRSYYNSPSWFWNSYGDRTCMNSPVQGSASDLMRLAMVRVDREISSKYPEVFRQMITVHDEINFSIRKGKFYEIMPQVLKIMQATPPQWKVPMLCDFSVGLNWGLTFPFKFEGDRCIPKGDKIS